MDSLNSVPGLKGAVTCDASGEVESFTDDTAENFGMVIPYVREIAESIGEPFGLEDFEQAIMLSKQMTCVIQVENDVSRGFILDAKAKVAQTLKQVL